MPVPPTLSAVNTTRRNVLGWGSAASITTIATYIGWPRNSPPVPTTVAKPHAMPPSHAPAVDKVAEETPPPEATVQGFSREAFLPHLQTNFTLIHEGDASAVCRLISVSPETRISSSKKTFIAFSILFEASPGFLLEGGTCRVKHEKMDEMQIFISPVGRPGKTALLEAAFTQAV